jgi:hypothetical protein
MTRHRAVTAQEKHGAPHTETAGLINTFTDHGLI